MLSINKYRLPRFVSSRTAMLLAACAVCTAALAQTGKKQYTMAEAVNGLSGALAPKGVKGAQWRPGTHSLYYTEGDFWLYSDVDKKVTDTSASVEDLNENILQAKPIKSLPPNKWVSKTQHYFQVDSTIIFYSGELHRLHIPSAATNITFFENGNSRLPLLAATVNNNLVLINDDSTTRITNDTNPNIINGQSVHRDEFGINGGIFFSPKGNFLAYYRMDQTMVKDYPVIDWSEIPAKNTNVKYPMAGDSSHQVTLRVYNIATQKTIELNTTHPDDLGISVQGTKVIIDGEQSEEWMKKHFSQDHYLTSVTWSPDEQYIYVGVLNRWQNHLWLNQYSAKTGEKIKTLFEETSDKYVEPQHPLAFLPGSNTQAIWWSQRDGYMHLWLYDMEKNSIKCLTPGKYVVNELIGFNAKKNLVLFTSTLNQHYIDLALIKDEEPREKHGYTVNWNTGKMRRLDTEPGTHTYIASDDGEYLFDVFTNETYVGGSVLSNRPALGPNEYIDLFPRRSLLRKVDGSIIKTVANSLNTLADFERPRVESISIKADDGTKLYSRLILPTNFDDHKKYPVIVYLYNGPHVQLVKNAFPASGNLWYEYLAQHGYIVWVMDGRGSANRGLKFEQATFRHLGTVEMEDQLRGVEYLKSLPFVDSTRMGVHGWSFGGFMTTSLMLRHPGVFKAGVAGGPVMDWRMYEVMYGERYMDTPQENPEGYKEAALFDKAKNLKGKLLLIHGTQDATVVWQHSIKFLKASVDQGVQVDYFVYPGYEHNVRGKDRVHLMQKVTDYFDTFLK